MYTQITQQIYLLMGKNAQVTRSNLESTSLKQLNLQNLSLRSICSRAFDIDLFHSTLTTGLNFTQELLNKVAQLLIFFKDLLGNQQEVNQIVIQIISEQAIPVNSNLHRNIQAIVKYSLQYDKSESLNDIVLWFFQHFLMKKQSPSQDPYLQQIQALPEIITGCLASSNLRNAGQLLNSFYENLSNTIIEDSELFKEVVVNQNEFIQRKIQQSHLICQLITNHITSKTLLGLVHSSSSISGEKSNNEKRESNRQPSQFEQSQQDFKVKNLTLTEQLNQYAFFYLQKSLKYYEIGSVPVFYELIVKLQKLQREENFQIELFLKNKLQKYSKLLYFIDIYEVVIRNINKTLLNQLVDFCNNMKKMKQLGFEVLSQLNTYVVINEIHVKLNSQLVRCSQQIELMRGLQKEESLLKEYMFTQEKLIYMLRELQELFVDSFYLEDLQTLKNVNKKYLIDKRVHQVVQLWNTYFESKSDSIEFLDIQSKSEEVILKKISFLQIANEFLLRDRDQQGDSFSTAVITELVFAKLDLCSSLQIKIKSYKKGEQDISITVVQLFIKTLYTFFMNLLANTSDLQMREKAIKDLSKSIGLLLTGDFDDVFKELRGEILYLIGSKQDYFQFEEQVGFISELLQAINQQCFHIEEDFYVSVETVKGSVESMRGHSVFRQLLQKAQGSKTENLQIGAILEKKVIDYKKVYQVLPLLVKCIEKIPQNLYASWSNMQAKSKLSSLFLELWIFLVLNNPYYMVPDVERGAKLQKNQLTQQEARDLYVVLQPMKEVLFTLQEEMNIFAFMTPNFLPGQFLSFLDSRIIQLLSEQRGSYTCQNFYNRCLRQQVKALFQLKKKTFDQRLTVQELLQIVIINEIFQRSFEYVQQDIDHILQSGESFVNKFVSYLKAPILTFKENPQEILQNPQEEENVEEVDPEVSIHRQTIQNINAKQIKGSFLIQETITRTALRYTEFLTKQRGTTTKEIICQDFVYFIQMSCSIERKLQEYSQDMLIDFIRLFPFACFSPEVVMAFSEAISFLYQKIGKEFDSKSHVMHSKHLKYQTLLHTDSKILTKTVVFLMNCVIKLVFRGLYIDHNFMKVLLLHLIKQETSLMSQLPFGYRFLKYVITSFRIDKDAIEAFKNEADRYNPYFWMTREVEFDSKLGQSDLSQFVSDKGLIRLQKLNLNERYTAELASDILKQIERSVRNEIELEFQLEGRLTQEENVSGQRVLQRISETINKLRKLCVQINLCQYVEINKPTVSKRMLQYCKEFTILIECVESSIINRLSEGQLQQEVIKIKKQLTTEMISQVAQLKNTLSLKTQNQIQMKSQIITQLFDICKQFLQPQLLKYILMRLLPFLHSISHNYFDQTFFFLLGETLNYTVYQINNLGNLKYDKKISAQDVFQIRQNYFNPLIEFELNEYNNEQVCLNYFKESQEMNLVNLAQISYYEQRWRSLCKMHFVLLKFLNDNMQIHLVKNVKLSVIANIVKLNFLIDKRLVEYLPLENVCQVVKGSIEILQLMKELKDKFKFQEKKQNETKLLHPEIPPPPQDPIRFDIEGFYYKTLKFGLSHFAKNQTLHKEPLAQQCQNLQRLKKNYNLFSTVCKQLQKDKLHELNEESRITRLKRVKKRFDALVYKSHRKEKLQLDGGKTVQVFGSPNIRKVQAAVGFHDQQFFGNEPDFAKMNVRPYYLRKALLLLLCDEIDKIKAWAFTKLQEEIQTEFSLQNQTKISENFLNQIIQEIPDKNLNLAYYIISKLFPILNAPRLETVEQAFYHFLGEKVTSNHEQYLDSTHFFDVYVHQNKSSSIKLKQLIYWRPPHIQVLLKYITSEYEAYPQVQLCFTKIMKRLHSEQIIFYLPQIVQSLGSKQGQMIKQFLIDFSMQSVLFAHQLLWLAKVECKIDPDHKRPPSPRRDLPDDYNILDTADYKNQLDKMIRKGEVPTNQLLVSSVCPLIIMKLIQNMDAEQKGFFRRLDGFFEQITSISAILRPQQPKSEKREIIARELSKIEVSSDVYMPSNPRFQIQSIKLDSGAPMQSAAKCPILVSFYCKKFEGPDKYFERKLRIKNQVMKQLTADLDQNQSPSPLKLQDINWDDQISEEEEKKEPLFIRQLTRPIADNLKRKQTIVQLDKQQQTDQFHYTFRETDKPRKIKRKPSAEEVVVELRVQRKKIEELTRTPARMASSIYQQTELKSCIFKVFDDIRQDNLALQVIQMFRGIFERVGLDLYVFPYKAISMRTSQQLNVGGIIEVIPNSISRDQVGKTNRCSLYDYYVNKFGLPDTMNFQVARENFIKSQAAYSVISYILQIKDRHNGNILISEKGNIIHIDFGFIFDISPGHNMKFESANFKLTREMIQIMGGSPDSEAFKYYMDLTIRAFLAVRRYYEHMYNLVRLMLHSGLKCFRKDSMKNFTERFQVFYFFKKILIKLKKNDLAAAKYMKEIIMDAYDKMTTRLYDDIQYLQNGISK